MAPLVRPARDAAGALLASAARATGRGLGAEHLSVLDGQTLNLAAVVPGVPAGAPVTVEFVSGQRRTSAAARTTPGPDGHTRLEATVRLRCGGESDPGGAPVGIPEVVLASGVWSIQLVVGEGDEERRLSLAAPIPAQASGPVPARRDARFGVTRTLSGTAALVVRPPRPAAYVRAVAVLPHCARVVGQLVHAGPAPSLSAELARCGGDTTHEVLPVLSAGPYGTEFTVELPLRAMSDLAAGAAGGWRRWGLRFRTADGTVLRAGRGRVTAGRAQVRPPERTVRPDDGPPVLVRPYYTETAALVISVTGLPSGD